MDASDTPESEWPELTPQQQRFCEEYIVDLRGWRAAIRAGYSPHTAKEQAYALLRKPQVAAYVEQLKRERSERTQITADRVLAELAAIAFSDLRDYSCNDAGQMKLTPGAPSFAARAVAAIKRKKNKSELSIEFKLWDKPTALRHLMPHVGLVTEKSQTEVTGKGGAPIRFTLSLGERSLEMPESDEDKPA